MCVTGFAFFTYLLTYPEREEMRASARLLGRGGGKTWLNAQDASGSTRRTIARQPRNCALAHALLSRSIAA